MNGHAAFFFLYDPPTHTHSLTHRVSNTWVFSLGGVLRAVLFVTSPPSRLTRFDRVPVRVMVLSLSLSPSHLQHIGFDVKATCGFIKAQLLIVVFHLRGSVFACSLKSLLYLKLVNVIMRGFAYKSAGR